MCCQGSWCILVDKKVDEKEGAQDSLKWYVVWKIEYVGTKQTESALAANSAPETAELVANKPSLEVIEYWTIFNIENSINFFLKNFLEWNLSEILK